MLSPKPRTDIPITLQFDLCGHRMTPLSQGALWWEHERTLVVSDLHLEKGSSYAAMGQHLPPYDTDTTLALVDRCVTAMKPDRVISLGDSFHDRQAASRLTTEQVQRIRRLTGVTDWVWIEGNHDPDPPEHLGGRAAFEIEVAGLVFRHEPTGEAGEISGHLHPCARLLGRGGRTVRRRCFVTDGQRLIMPAMGAFTGGLNVLDVAYRPVMGAALQAFMMGAERVYAVPGARLIPDRPAKSHWRL